MCVAFVISCWQSWTVLCLRMAAREFAGSAQDMGITNRAEGSIARAEHLKVGYWGAKLLLLLEVFLENPGPGVL